MYYDFNMGDYDFNMDDPESVNKIQRVRKQVFIEKQETASLTEKRVIALGIIKFKAFVSDSYLQHKHRGGDICEIMEFFVDEKLYTEVVRSGQKDVIEESIRKAFMKALPHRDMQDGSIQKVIINMLDDSLRLYPNDAIFPDFNWVSTVDLQTETPVPTQDKPKEESKPKKEEQVKATTQPSKPKEVFIVHGRDNDIKDLKLLLIEKMKVMPIVLQDTNTKSDTLIEALERRINRDTDFVIVLMTPDDFGRLKDKEEEPRARQNVIFEMGMAIGAMGREKVFIIKREDLQDPSDISGIIYHKYEKNIKELSDEIREALRDEGFDVY